MKRLIAAAFSITLVATGMTLNTSPASATEVCVGAGTASTPPVFYPTFGGSASGGVTFNFTVGTCVVSGANTVGGEFRGNLVGNYCGHSTGRVTLPDGSVLDWVSAASVLVFTSATGTPHVGGGVVVAVPDALSGQSCASTSGATTFRVAGAVAAV